MSNYTNNNNINKPDKKKKNKFIELFLDIFIRDWIIKLFSLIGAVTFWLLAVGLGISGSQKAESIRDIFINFNKNILEQFSSNARTIASLVDIFLLFVIVYIIVRLVCKNGATPIIKFMVTVVLIVLILASPLISMPVMGSIFSNGILIVLLILIIMFPQEIRRMMWKLASKSGNESKFNVNYNCTEEELNSAVNDIVKALLNMSKDNVGALIIITTQTIPKHILESGTALGAKLSQPLIECLFNTNADLHDGAVFIHGDKILAAGCFLPLSQNQSLPKELGTRHRAALGISEQYDVLTIVVSEETGIISVAQNGRLERYYDGEMLTDVIKKTYGLKANNSSGMDARDNR